MKPILITHWRSPGDIVLLTGAVRDLVRTCPNKYEIHVACSCPELWENNPHVSGVWGLSAPRNIPLYPIRYERFLSQANFDRLHFLTAFHRALGNHLGLEIPVYEPCGDLHLSMKESNVRPVPGRYWLLVAGGKRDIQTKIWPYEYSQKLVTLLAAYGIRIVQVGSASPGHLHPRLSGVEDLIGKTTLRELIQLIYHADGVICPVTAVMHMSAALQIPCVVIAGGREPYWWECYQNLAVSNFGPQCAPVTVPHRFFHSQGKFPCCEHSGCWKTSLRRKGEPGLRDCVLPVLVDGEHPRPTCLTAIPPEEVVDAVMSYYRDGTLVPITKTELHSRPTSATLSS